MVLGAQARQGRDRAVLVHEGLVVVQHTLRIGGCARGVQQQADIVGIGDVVDVGVRDQDVPEGDEAVGQRALRPDDDDHGRFVEVAPQARQHLDVIEVAEPVRDANDLRSGLTKDEADLVVAVDWDDWIADRTRQVHAVVQDLGLPPVRQLQRDDVPALHAKSLQTRRSRLDPGPQFPVGQAGVALDDRCPRRGMRGRLDEERRRRPAFPTAVALVGGRGRLGRNDHRHANGVIRCSVNQSLAWTAAISRRDRLLYSVMWVVSPTMNSFFFAVLMAL